MKKMGLVGIFAVTSLAGCSDPIVPSAELDKLTLAFLNAKIYASGAVSCDPKQVKERAYVGCHNKSLEGNSQVSLWLYEGGEFKAVNGTARTFVEGPFAGESGISSMPLPLPNDINVGEVLESFK